MKLYLSEETKTQCISFIFLRKDFLFAIHLGSRKSQVLIAKVLQGLHIQRFNGSAEITLFFGVMYKTISYQLDLDYENGTIIDV